MKTTTHNSHNRAEEVITRAEEELALAKLIRCGADKDLVQVQKTIEVLNGKLATVTKNWNALWKSFRSVADLLRTPTDEGQSWAQFIPQVPTRFQEFVKEVRPTVYQECSCPGPGSFFGVPFVQDCRGSRESRVSKCC